METKTPLTAEQLQPEKKCFACHQMIPLTAPKCFHCDQWQVWNGARIISHLEDELGTLVIACISFVVAGASLVISLMTLFNPAPAPKSIIVADVRELRMRTHPIPAPGEPTAEPLSDSSVLIELHFFVRNDGNAPGMIQVFCKDGGCVAPIDVSDNSRADGRKIAPQDFRLLRATIGEADIAKLRQFSDDELQGICQRALRGDKLRPDEERFSLYVNRELVLRALNHRAEEQQLKLSLDETAFFKLIKSGPIDTYSVRPIPQVEPVRMQ